MRKSLKILGLYRLLFSELSHEADQLKLMRCLRGQLKSSAEAAIILEQSRAIQGIPKTTRELKAERGKVWTRLFFSTLFLSLIFNTIDIGSDTLILIRYWRELSRGESLFQLNQLTTNYQQINNKHLSLCPESGRRNNRRDGEL